MPRFEQEVRDLGEAAARRRVSASENDVAVFQDVADVALRTVFHAPALYRTPGMVPAYPLLVLAGGLPGLAVTGADAVGSAE